MGSRSGLPLFVVLAFCCAACSSGGPRAPSVAPSAPAPAPAPAPTPPPPSTDFRTLEYQRNSGLERINVVPAYERGGSGAGVIIGIVDTGIDVSNIEFAGRIDPRSADLVRSGVVPPGELRPGGPNLQDVDGHGTSVAGILAAAKNDLGMHGVAFGATLLVYRGDKEGEPGTIFGEAIEEGVRRSVANGARVMNFSFGTDEPGAQSDFDFYFNLTSGNNIFVAVSAGNGGNPDPDESALAAIDPAARGSVIIVGAVDSTNTISTFSNRAGSGASFFLVAPGEFIRTPALGGPDGSTVLFSGTSAATPFVAGAASLIRQLWPSLTAAEVADILLTSATDLGAPGVDTIYGHGLLNVGAAIAPLGTTTTSSVAGVTLTPEKGSFSPGPAFGAAVPDFGDFVFLDSYGRDFRGSLNDLAGGPLDLRADPVAFLQPFSDYSFASLQMSDVTARFRMLTGDASITDPAAALRDQGGLRLRDTSEVSETLGAAFAQPLGDNAEYLISFGFGPREIDRPLSGRAARALARDAFADGYLPARDGGFVNALRWRFGSSFSADLFLAHTDGDIGAGARDSFGQESFASAAPQTNIRFGLTRSVPGGAVRVESGIAHERGRLFGADFFGLFGDSGANTTFYQAGAFDLGITHGWRALARGALGFTRSDADAADGFFAGVDNLISSQFSLGAYKQGVFSSGDRLAISASQPLRIESGSAHLIVPARFDYDAGGFEFENRFVSLGAAAREIDLEASYSAATRFGVIEVNLLRQFNAAAGGEGATAGVIRTRRWF